MLRRSSITLLTCVSLAIFSAIMWSLQQRTASSRNDAATPAGLGAKSKARDAQDEALAMERKVARQAREALRDDPELKAIWIEDTIENSWLRDLLKPFNASELQRMIDGGATESTVVAHLLLRAAAEKHPGFQDLLARPELRKDPQMDMALCAYDYSVNGNHEALDRIVETHRAAAASEEACWTDPAAWALGYVDEWDLTRQALGSHRMTNGDADFDGPKAFWLTRRYLFPRSRNFPEDYRRFTEHIPR